MRVAIVHYHLAPGGVSTVIAQASAALTASSIPHIILAGSAPETDVPVGIVEGLCYRKSADGLTAGNLLRKLRATAAEALGGPPDIWHFHNHSLGKNVLLPEVVDSLALAGERLVLQLHDLAEDGRPQNYPFIPDPQRLYPLAPQIRYAFINPRDLGTFVDAGLPAAHALIVPNSSEAPLSEESGDPSPTPLILCPVRGIRRKNLGELLLLSLLSPPDCRFAISRAPDNPEALPVHDAWRLFAESHGLRVDFAVADRLTPPGGKDSSFRSWSARATYHVTTSVAEGFGFVFSGNKPLIGRDLHQQATDSLYERILIPGSWIDEDRLQHHLTADLTETCRLYGKELPADLIAGTSESLRHGDHLDFGNLPEALQRSVLVRLLHSPLAPVLIESNGRVEAASSWLASRLGDISRRQGHFSETSGGENDQTTTDRPDVIPAAPRRTFRRNVPALDLYQELLAAPISEVTYLSPAAVLDAYLGKGHFHFLLTAPPRLRAVIFDIYGTLLIAPPGSIKPDSAFDPLLSEILRAAGHLPPASLTTALHEIILHHHAASTEEHPEIDLREVWREILGTPITDSLIGRIEDARLPCREMPGAGDLLHQLSEAGLHLGLLSNAQVNTLPTLDRLLGGVLPLFEPDLTVLSYQHGIAKPSQMLFGWLADRLAALGIAPDEILFVGNDPLQDILPAARAGFRTALFTGHPASVRPGGCKPDLILNSLSELPKLIQNL